MGQVFHILQNVDLLRNCLWKATCLSMVGSLLLRQSLLAHLLANLLQEYPHNLGVEILKEHGYTEEKIQAMLDSGAMYVWKA